jgi:hypothetical protein
MKLKFNHSAESISEATGIDVEKLAEKATQTISDFMEDDEKQTTSHLAEMVNKDYTKAELVILTTQHMVKMLEGAKRRTENPALRLLEMLGGSETESETESE